MNKNEYKREQALKSTKGINLNNRPITEKEQKKLPIGFHTHPFENRRARRQWEHKSLEGNNRKRTRGRLMKKVTVKTKELQAFLKEGERHVCEFKGKLVKVIAVETNTHKKKGLVSILK